MGSTLTTPRQMQQEALVPRPRGRLPKVLSITLAVVAAAAFALCSPVRSLCGFAMVTLGLTLGPLAHGLCLLAEEMSHHAHTRHRGRAGPGHMLAACGVGGKTLLAAVLAVLLLLCQAGGGGGGGGGAASDSSHCYSQLLLAAAFYPLFKSLGVLGPSEVEVSETCEGRKMNVAHGLAWSFYTGYLRLVLPRLEEAITTFRASHQSSGAGPFRGRGSRRLLLLVPLNANVAHKLEDEDDNVHFYDSLPNVEMDRAGVRGRVYKHSVYSVVDENNTAHECVVEYATPLLTLYSMSQESTAGFGESQRRQQVLLFYTTLRDILERSLECRNHYHLILLNDEREEDPHFLSKTILRHLRQQEREEYCVAPPPHQEEGEWLEATPATPPQATRHDVAPRAEPMTREPTLMISLDAPQPLREAVEHTYRS